VRILLIGNYAPDAQESMLRYAQMMLHGLARARHDVTLATPQAILNPAQHGNNGVWKWIGYLDKYWAGTGAIAHAVREADLVHVCDHSNSVYVPRIPSRPYVVTCHDLLAVRGALGEDTDCAASPAGRYLQRAILSGLRRAHSVACVSRATLSDARRLLGAHYPGQLSLVPNALNYPYRRLDGQEARRRVAACGIGAGSSYILHVGNDHPRKNRVLVLEAFARICAIWRGKLVLAGQPMQEQMRRRALSLGIAERVIEVVKPSDELLEGLYNAAHALVFPSRFEGFGWPIIEAQACGCPVICSDRAPLPEVAGRGAIVCPVDDPAAVGEAILHLAQDPERREDLRRLGAENAGRYGLDAMIGRFLEIYERLAQRYSRYATV
jgi:glycosyltransferase involved in cell wall biosynthesis